MDYKELADRFVDACCNACDPRGTGKTQYIFESYTNKDIDVIVNGERFSFSDFYAKRFVTEMERALASGVMHDKRTFELFKGIVSGFRKFSH